MNIVSSHPARRLGLSIMEVIFAIGVLLIGLLGIASILPVGANNANNALRADATTAAIENQISNAVGRLPAQLTFVDVPNASLISFQANPTPITPPFLQAHGPYSGLSPALIGYQVARGGGALYRRVDLSAPTIVKSEVRAETPIPIQAPPLQPRGLPVAGFRDLNFSTLPPPAAVPDPDWLFDPIQPQLQSAPLPRPSFCIDPAFLSASSNIRNDVGLPGSRSVNGYDRTQFPCYDLNYNPEYTPSQQLGGAASFAMTPRMYRIGLPNLSSMIPTNVTAKVMLSERDEIPLFRPTGEYRNFPPGMLVRPTGATVGPTTSQRTGRYSTMITLVPTSAGGRGYEASVVVYESRSLLINELGTLPPGNEQYVFNLQPYASALWDDPNKTAIQQTYGEEVLGIVESAPGPITGGVGVFTYVHSAACDPRIGTGDWVMLGRWIPEEGINRFAWYKVTDVLQEPTIDSSGPAPLYRTTIEVRGGDWLFHPTQVATGGVNTGVAGPYTYNPPGGAVHPYNRRVTTIVKMPSVVSVRTMSISL